MSEPISFHTAKHSFDSASAPQMQEVEAERVESIFSSVDANGDGIVSTQEAKDYGFNLFEVKEDLKKENFQIKYAAHIETQKNNDYSQTDFSELFSKPDKDGNVVHDVTLSFEQQKALLNNMKAFDEYRSSLAPEQQKELDDNKRAIIDYKLQDWMKDKNYRTYDEFTTYYNDFKNQLEKDIKAGKATTLKNEDLAQILYHIDTSDMVSDGKLGSSAQGMTGDCWALSQLSNYAQSEEGAKNISDRIKEDKANKKFTINFQNPKNPQEIYPVEVSYDELKNFGVGDMNNSSEKSGDFSSGDIDTRVYEVAVNKMLNDMLPKQARWDGKTNNMQIAGGDPIKRVMLHRAMGYGGDIKVYQTSLEEKNNFAQKYAPEIYDKNDKNAIYEVTFGLDEKGELVSSVIKLDKDIKTLSDVLALHPEYKAENLTCNSQFAENRSDNGLSKNDRYLQAGHVFNIKSVGDESIIVQDPYISTFPIAITKERFNHSNSGNNFIRMTYMPSFIEHPAI